MELSEIRKEIDLADEALLGAFLRRMELCRQVGQYKAQAGLPVLNRAREREILDRVMAESGDLAPYAHRLYTTLFELSRSCQAPLTAASSPLREKIAASLCPDGELFPDSGTVACQGVEGAYSQMAADAIFPRGSLMFFKTFESVFDAVKSGLCRYGVLPIENSSNGSVQQVYDLIRRKNVSIIRSKRLCISHRLLVKPGVSLSEITEIHSHEQALGQCSAFLKSLGSRVKVISEPNTALAAELVAKSENRGAAAISSSDCAGLYGLEALPANIQNSDNNYTRFIVITKTPRVYPGANRISLILALEHRPGSLYDILARLAALELNLLKLESRPMVGHDFEFRFFFEFEGSVRDQRVVSMLSELERQCPEFCYLGNYGEF